MNSFVVRKNFSCLVLVLIEHDAQDEVNHPQPRHGIFHILLCKFVKGIYFKKLTLVHSYQNENIRQNEGLQILKAFKIGSKLQRIAFRRLVFH